MTKIQEKTAVINVRDSIRGYVILSKGGVCKDTCMDSFGIPLQNVDIASFVKS